MRLFSSSRFVAVTALVLATTVSTTAITACSAPQPEESAAVATYDAALESDSSTVTIRDSSGAVIWEQTVEPADVPYGTDAEGHVVVEMADGRAITVLSQSRTEDGRTLLTVRAPDGTVLAISADVGGKDVSGIQPKIVWGPIIAAAIAAVVVVTVVAVSAWSHSKCLDILIASQQQCRSTTPPGNWSGSCSGGGIRDAFLWTATYTCTAGDPRPTHPPQGLPNPGDANDPEEGQ